MGLKDDRGPLLKEPVSAGYLYSNLIACMVHGGGA